jgi:hypothetical protein
LAPRKYVPVVRFLNIATWRRICPERIIRLSGFIGPDSGPENAASLNGLYFCGHGMVLILEADKKRFAQNADVGLLSNIDLSAIQLRAGEVERIWAYVSAPICQRGNRII